MIVISYPTIMDGQVLRWYRDETAAEIGHESMSASRHGVNVRGYLHEIPEAAMNDASEAYSVLATGGDMSHLATHRLVHGLGYRKVEKIESKGSI